MARTQSTEMPLARVGTVEVSKYETATGARLRLRRVDPPAAEAYLDPLELEGLTRLRHTPTPALLATRTDLGARPRAAERMEPLQNEFALVGVGEVRDEGEHGLLIRDMNAGQAVLLTAEELDALLRAHHMDFAPLIDTSNLVALPEPDIDEA